MATSETPGTARTRVRTALAHRQPDRVPFSWQFCATSEMSRLLTNALAADGVSWPSLLQATEDFVTLDLPIRQTGQPATGRRLDIWGIRRHDVAYQGGSYQEIAEYPLAGIDSVAALDDYPWPTADCFDYSAMAGKLAHLPADRAVRFLGFNPFETLCWLWGLEEVLCACATQPELVVHGLEHITAFYEERLRRALPLVAHAVDVVFFFDDLGGQHGSLLSPSMYRDLIKPFHQRLFSAARELAPNAHIMMHSDGSVFDLLDDLIDAGMDVLEAVQVECARMDPALLKETFGDRLSFHGAISVQQLLPKADEEGVRRACRNLIDTLGEGGGYIAAPSHAIQIGTPVKNVLAMLQTVLGDDDYRAAWETSRIA